MPEYLGIEFAGDYKGTLADFKEQFGSNHIFKKFLPTERAKHLKEAYKVATSKKDGNISGPTKESEQTPANEA